MEVKETLRKEDIAMEKILVTRSSMPPIEEYFDEIRDLWDTHWLTNMGEKHQELEKKLEEYLDIPNLVLFVNGHSALECILEAMNLPEGGEVITTPFTFASTTHAIVRKGLKPVFCDINPRDYTMDVTKIEELITEKTCAILPVHVYGNLCNVDRIQEIADRYKLKVIYDAAHAFGVRKDGHGVGNYGDASMFSFHATKVFNTIEGGAITFKDENLREILNSWKNFGIRIPEQYKYIGGNSKMNEFSAAMGLCNLRHVDDEIEKRSRVYKAYQKRLSNVNGLVLCKPQEGVSQNYAYYPVVFDDCFGATRDDVFEALAQQGIVARKYFYPLTNEFECYAGLYSADKTPVAKRIAERVLTLPMYADLAEEQVNRICDIILNLKDTK